MKKERAIKIIDNLAEDILSLTDDISVAIGILKEAGLKDDEITLKIIDSD